MKSNHISLAWGILTIGISMLGFFWKLDFIESNSNKIILFLFGVLIVLIWFNNKNEIERDKIKEELDKKRNEIEIERDKKHEEREHIRDINEQARQKKTFDILYRLTNAIVEIFPNSEYHNRYYEFKISTANHKVDDLTWATFDKEGKLDAPRPKYLEKIQMAADGGVNYDEIFIFQNKDSKLHYDRLKKLKYHYNKAKKHMRTTSRYSCSYFAIDELGFDFPRIQFTLIDNDEILFTSSANNNEKFRIKNSQLTKVFKNYYEQAWSLSEKLIVNGEIENEDKILELIKPLENEKK